MHNNSRTEELLKGNGGTGPGLSTIHAIFVKQFLPAQIGKMKVEGGFLLLPQELFLLVMIKRLEIVGGIVLRVQDEFWKSDAGESRGQEALHIEDTEEPKTRFLQCHH